MEKQCLLNKIAPCVLLCHTCAAAKSGVIRERSQKLLQYLEGFEGYVEMLSAYQPGLKKYPEFAEVLRLLADASCDGCRDGVCKFPGCEIAPCTKEKGHDYCFQCESFPCDKVDQVPVLKRVWLKANQRMKEIGPEAYFERMKTRSHYA